MSVQEMRSGPFGNSAEPYRQSSGREPLTFHQSQYFSLRKPPTPISDLRRESTYCWAASNLIRRMARHRVDRPAR
jgi:hypothetical protein